MELQIKPRLQQCLLGLLLLAGAMLPVANRAFAEPTKEDSASSSTPPTGATMPTPPFDNQTAIAGMPGNRIQWVKSPIVTRLGFYQAVENEFHSIVVYYETVVSNPGMQVAQVTSMPMPAGFKFRIRAQGKDILPKPPKVRLPSGIQAPPDEDMIRRSTHELPPGYVGQIFRSNFELDYFQLLPGTHIYELVYWQSQLNWLNVRDGIASTDTGKGKLRYPVTDNAPSNRIYFKVYAPTEEEAKQGKGIQFLGEVDAATQVPRFPYVRPGDFATKTGKWRAIGPSIEELGGGPYEVNVQRGDQMPNLPGDKGVDPFSFLWQFDPDSKDQMSYEDTLRAEQDALRIAIRAVKVGQVCPLTGTWEASIPGNDIYASKLREHPKRIQQFEKGQIMPGHYQHAQGDANLTWRWLYF